MYGLIGLDGMPWWQVMLGMPVITEIVLGFGIEESTMELNAKKGQIITICHTFALQWNLHDETGEVLLKLTRFQETGTFFWWRGIDEFFWLLAIAM